MKSITLKDLEKINYNQSGISNSKLIDGLCVKCGNSFEYCSVKHFLKNRRNVDDKSLWNSCQRCWFIIRTRENEEWVEKNRQAQLISQNKPEQKKKNAEGVSKSWTEERKKKNSELLKNRWKNDPVFAEKAMKNISWTRTADEDRFRSLMKKSVGCGGLKGIYKNINYDSALELSFILWCEHNNILIKRYDLEPLQYFDECGVTRRYFPDFIINGDEIIEIKGYGIFYIKNYERNIIKIETLKKSGKKYRIYFSNDICVKKFYNIARRLHHENKK